MSDQILPVKLSEAIATQTERRWDSSVGMRLLGRLTGADYLSLVALFFAWSSAVLLLQGSVHLGILVMFGAFLFDKLDGYYARKHDIESSFGRQVDSFIDIFAYLVTGALLYHVALSPSPWMTVLVGFTLLMFGGLRLVRHADEGFSETDGKSYYVGWTVVHINFIVLTLFYLNQFVPAVTGWIAAIPIVVTCPLMVSGYKSYKTHMAHALGAVFVLTAFTVSFITMFTSLL